VVARAGARHGSGELEAAHVARKLHSARRMQSRAMGKWAARWFATSVVAASTWGCSSSGDEQGESKSGVARESASPDDAALASKAARNFGWKFFQQLEDPTKNLVFSPYGISVTTAMLSAGAANRTLDQIQHALEFDEVGKPLHHSENALDEALQARNHEDEHNYPGQTLTLGNDLWLQASLPVRQTFLDTLARYYGAGVHRLNFAGDPGGAVRTINDRIASDTHGLIPELVSPDMVMSSTALVLTNAVYFNAHWHTEFDPAEPGPFQDVDGDAVQVDTMKMTDDFEYAEADGFRLLFIPYVSLEIDMGFILPPEGDFATQAALLDSDRVAALVAASNSTRVSLSLPKFDARTVVPLVDELKRAGMTDAFDGSADFSGLTDDLRLNMAVHEAALSIDEKGTTAASGTAFGGTAGTGPPPPPPIPFQLNRPFVFLIRDVATDTPLFIGQYVGPSGADRPAN
jgi:serpin B